jgi:hypothetical protein
MAFHAEQDNIRVMPLTAKSLMKAVASGILPRARGPLNSSRSVNVVKLQSILRLTVAPIALRAVQVKSIISQRPAVKPTVLLSAVVVGASLFQMHLTQMLFTYRLILAIATGAILSPLVIIRKGLP